MASPLESTEVREGEQPFTFEPRQLAGVVASGNEVGNSGELPSDSQSLPLVSDVGAGEGSRSTDGEEAQAWRLNPSSSAPVAAHMVVSKCESGAEPQKRRPFQRLASGLLRSQIAHPSLPGRRLSLTARTPGHLYEQKRYVDELARDLQIGRKSQEQVTRALRGLLYGPLNAAAAWDTWVATESPQGQAKARSVWKNMFAESFAAVLLIEIEGGALDDWQALMQREGYAPKSIRAAYWCLAAAAKRAIRDRRIDGLPWGEWRPKKGASVRPREAARNVGELEALLRACLDQDRARATLGFYADLAHRATVIALLGLRQGEAAGLGWDRIDLVNGIVTIEFQALDSWRTHWPKKERPDFPLKNKKSHRQKIHPSALEALCAQKCLLEKWGLYRADGPVFPATFNNGRARHNGWRSNANTIKPEKMKTIAVAAGVPNADRWVVHSLRHSFASLEVANGNDLKSAQGRTGHASMRQLEEYVHASRELPASAIPLLELGHEATLTERAAQAVARARAGLEKAEMVVREILERRRARQALLTNVHAQEEGKNRENE